MVEKKISELTLIPTSLTGNERFEISAEISSVWTTYGLKLSDVASYAAAGSVAKAGDTMSGNLFNTSGLVVGGTSKQSIRAGTASYTPDMQSLGTGASAAFLIARYSDSGQSPRIAFGKSRGTTIGAHTATNNNDILGEFSFSGSNGTVFAEGARMQIRQSGAVGTDYTPSAIVFATSDGTAAPALRLNIGPDGSIYTPNATIVDTASLLMARTYTVGALPTPGTAGRMAWASNCRVFNGTGTREGAGAGTGGLVTDNGTNWVIAGTNVTAAA